MATGGDQTAHAGAFSVRFVARDQWKRVTMPPSVDRRAKVKELLRLVLTLFDVASTQDRRADPEWWPSGASGGGGEAGGDGGSVLFTPASADLDHQLLMKEYGLYLPARGFWMDDEKALADYGIQSLPCTDGDLATALKEAPEIIELQHRRLFVRTLSTGHYCEGCLLKKGDKSIVWKRRFFVLRDYRLHYLKRRSDTPTTGHIDLSRRFRLDSRQCGHPLEFHIVTAEKVYRLQASSSADHANWLRVLGEIHWELSGLLAPRQVKVVVNEPQPESMMANDWELEETSSGGETDSDDIIDDDEVDLVKPFSHLNLASAVGRRRAGSAMKSDATVQQHGNVDIQGDKIGFMYKKGAVNKAMQLRLFVLRDKLLYYYRTVTANSGAANNGPAMSLSNSNFQFAGLINLEGCRIFGDQKHGKKAWIFRLVTPSRVYVISTADGDEWHDWRDAFEYVCGIVVDGGGSGGSGGGGTSNPGSPDTNSAGFLRPPGAELFGSRRLSVADMTDLSSGDDSGSPHCAPAPNGKPHKQRLALDFTQLGLPEFQGELWKRGNDRIGKWRKRYFVLVGRTLFYGKVTAVSTGRPLQPIGSIPLTICQLAVPESGSPGSSNNNNSNTNHYSTYSSHTDSSNGNGESGAANKRLSVYAQSLAFDLVVTHQDNPSKPALRVYHLHAESYAQFSSWISRIAVHTETSRETVTALLQSRT